MALTAAVTADAAGRLQYPEAPSGAVTDTYFGTTVTDTYRPLENDTAAATLQWVEAERKLTEDYMSKIPFREICRRAT